jgi:hypothetical protein
LNKRTKGLVNQDKGKTYTKAEIENKFNNICEKYCTSNLEKYARSVTLDKNFKRLF